MIKKGKLSAGGAGAVPRVAGSHSGNRLRCWYVAVSTTVRQ
jgi:hypothetical protein